MAVLKSANITENYTLNAESIDLIAAKVEEFLYSIGMERSNVLGIRLSLEESLLRWLDHFGPKGEEPELEFFADKK